MGPEHDDAAGRRRRPRRSVRGAGADPARSPDRSRAGEAARRARAVGGVRRSGLRRREPHPRPAARPPQGGPGPDRAGGRDLERRRARPAVLAGGPREGRLRAFRARARARARAAGPLHRLFRRHGRVRAPVRHPARRLRARPDDRGAAGIFARLQAELVPLVSAAAAAGEDGHVFPGHFPREAQQRMADELLHAVGFETEHWRLDPSVHPFARSMAATDVRLTTRWEEHDLAMAFYSCLHEFGHGLYEAQFEPRHYRTTLAEATGLGVHESQIAAVGEPRRPLASVLRVGAAAAAAQSRRAVRDDGRRVDVPRRQPGPAVADPDRGRRDDLQPPHRAALRARAGDGRRPARGRRPAGRLGRGHAPAARAGDPERDGGRPAGHPLGRGDDRLLPDVHDREPDGRRAVAGAVRRSARHRRPDRGRRLRARCASGCARTSTATAASTTPASCSGGRRGRSSASSRGWATSRASCWMPDC